MIPVIDKCDECGHDFVIAKRDSNKKVCMSCDMWERTQKDKPPVEKTKPTAPPVDINLGEDEKADKKRRGNR